MRVATTEESRRIDELAQSRYALSGEILMESAGALSAREIEISFMPEIASGRGIDIICGPGNNGADGLVVARHLSQNNLRLSRKISVYYLAPSASTSDQQAAASRPTLFHLQLERCRKLGLSCTDLAAEKFHPKGGVIVDAIFGIGLKRALGAPFRNLVERINSSCIPVVSLDVPSGLDADRGVVHGADSVAIKAQMTLTFGLAKPGFFVSDGPKHVGRLRVLPIGFPLEATRETARSTSVFTEAQLRRALPKWNATSHKSDHGHALLFAGSDEMRGAGVLAATAAFRSGAGYVTLAGYGGLLDGVQLQPEILTARADDESLWKKPRWTAAGIGPGFGANGEAEKLVRQLCDRLREIPDVGVVVDADAFTVLARQKTKCPPSWIVTPHAGELSRLLDVSAAEIENDRFRYVREAAGRLGCFVLLKGFRTVICEPVNGHVTIIPVGNSALAKAGTGDVLTGLITGLLAQGVRPALAAAAGAYLHGRMADDWVRAGQSRRSLIASDLRDLLPPLLARLQTLG